MKLTWSLFWSIVIAGSVFCYHTKMPTNNARETLFAWACASSAFYFGLPRRKAIIPAMLFMLGFGALHYVNVNGQLIEMSSGFRHFTMISLGALLFSQSLDSGITGDLKIIKGTLATISVIATIWIVLESTGINPFKWTPAPWVITAPINGPLLNQGSTGALLAMTWHFLPVHMRIYPLVAMGIIAYFGTITPLIAAAAPIVLIPIIKRKLWAGIASGAVIASGVGFITLTNPADLVTRFDRWRQAITFRPSIWFGHGLGFVRDVFPMLQYPHSNFNKMHSDIIDLYLAGGLVVTIPVAVVILLTVLSKASEIKVRDFYCCLVSFLVFGLTWFPIYIPSLAVIGIISLGIVIGSGLTRRI